ncbi:acylphosphatase [Lentilactobacillus otakiensis]|uniref:acylphosphatase n=1 Tax=Lentilactobacillus otakiensis TaxID=481720 RepID=UPI003D175FEF
MNDNIKTVKMNASGLVQGVGFRWATIQIAESLDISGWVKNEPDGSVSILASGSRENLDHFIEKIRQSPTSFAKVRSLQINYIAKRVNKGFNVKY